MLKPNADKSHLCVTTERSFGVNIAGSHVKDKKEPKLLAIKFDAFLYFEGHITSLCKKASQKLHALGRIVNYLDLSKRKFSMKAFITSQFSDCPILWMLRSRTLNNHSNKIHEKVLRLTYKDNQSSYKELLERPFFDSSSQKF